jgi:hypothetical protein
MNKRIQELAEQAGEVEVVNVVDTGDGLMETQVVKEFDREWFALLIVRECIKIVEPTSHHQVWAQSYLGGVDGLELLEDKVEKIRQHFGVEE